MIFKDFVLLSMKLAATMARLVQNRFNPTMLRKGYYSPARVQAFNSCTSRPDVCQCLVVQILRDKVSKNKPITQETS